MELNEDDPFGYKIIDAAVREFWLDGQISSPCCPIFLKDELLRCWRIFYDDEKEKWSMDVDGIIYPTVGTATGDDHMQWRDVKLRNAENIVGSNIVNFKQSISENVCEALIPFENKSVLRLKYNIETAVAEYVVSKTC